MLPYLHIGSFHLPTFGLMLWLAAVAGAIIVDRAFKRAHIDADAVGMVAVALVVGIIGAKVWHVLDTPSEFREIGWRVLWDNAGFAWYGGLTFGIAALVVDGLAGEAWTAADAGSLCSGGGDRLRHRADRVLSFGRRLLWDRDPACSYLRHHVSSVGNGISERNRAGSGSGLSRLRFTSWEPGC